MKRPAYILIVNNASENVLSGVEDVYKHLGLRNLRALVLTANPEQYASMTKRALPVEIIPCSFGSSEEIVAALQPFKNEIQAVVCGGEKHIQYLRKVVPHLPRGVLAATPESLEIATNKRLMREAFLKHFPEISPKFVRVYNAERATIQAVENAIQYPVILKPANLASSLLIQSCYSGRELKTALTKVFNDIKAIYQREGRRTEPQVIVEEYLEGDFYSIDAYAMAPGQFYYCPPVGYIPAKHLGIDDFFLYKRFIPTKLTPKEIAEVNQTVAKALTAVGLTHSSAHVELVLTSRGWRVIELGPRLGRFRQLMYGASYDFSNYMNDVLIHLGHKPRISDTLLQYSAGYLIYPEKEGTLRELAGLAKLEADPATQFLRVFARPGDRCLFSKHGGRAVAEFVIAHKDPAVFQKTVSFVENHVKAIVD